MTKSARLQIITEIVGALAVVITLIFLIVEIQQNTEQTKLNARAVEMAAYQDLIAQISDLNTVIVENPQFAEVWDIFEDGGELTPVESQQLSSYVWLLMRHGDMAFYQYQLGAIDEERLKSSIRPLTARLESRPFIRERWEGRKHGFAKAYRDYIDNHLQEWKRANPEEVIEQEAAANQTEVDSK